MLSGTFATMPFADLLQWISDARRSGTLQVGLEFEERYLRFVDGSIGAYGSDDPMARDLGRRGKSGTPGASRPPFRLRPREAALLSSTRRRLCHIHRPRYSPLRQ